MPSAVPPSAAPHRLRDEAIERLLASGERKRELVALLGEDAYRELSELARRAQAVRRAGPVAYVLPGLMGSRIGTRGKWLDDVIWLDPVAVAAGHLTRLALPRGSRLAPLGVMLLNALKLKLSLQVAGFDARFHAYDWRRGIDGLAAELNSRIATEGSREALLVGHSMGGVVARVALASDPGRIARVVQLGSPNLGSFAPVLALRAVYPTVRKLAALDLRHDAEDLARIVFRTLPSLHELLPDPAPGGTLDLLDPSAWPDDELRPDRRLLDAAAAARARWPAADDRCLHIVGVRQETVTQAERHGSEFHYTLERDGDGTVPRRLATLPGAKHLFVAEKHGGLPNNGKVISAVVDLLRTGSTERLPAETRQLRARAKRTVSESVLRRVAPRKVRWQDLSPDARRRLLEPVISPEFHGTVAAGTLRPLPTVSPGGTRAAGERVVELRLVQGDIADADASALVLGLFRNVAPSGASVAIDVRLGGTIREFARRRMLAAGLGQVTTLPVAPGQLHAGFVVLAGLGDFDDFGADAQSLVAGNVVRSLARAGVGNFATVLFGSGSGVPVAAAVEQQLAGFVAGLSGADPDGVVRRITICELDARKYAALRRAAVNSAQRLSNPLLRIVVKADGPAQRAAAPKARRPEAGQRDPVYLLVTLVEQGRSEFLCRSSLLTAGAKAAVLSGAVRVSRKALRAHLAPAESGRLAPRDMARFGRGLAQLLLPESVRAGLAAMQSRPVVVVHDSEGSRVPWETLHTGNVHPALEGGLTRRYASDTLTVARWNEHRAPGARLQVLVVVDPTLDLPGAADEGAALSRMLRAGGAEVELLSGAAATRGALLREFASGRHDVLHFAGHGFFDSGDPGSSGLVCAGREVLRGADLDALGNLPALVFFNACEAARVRRSRQSPGARLFAFRRSTSVAEAFLGGGVANFIGTHWPVGDQAALVFSTSFYQRLLDGALLGDCVLAARRQVAAIGSIDWADYVLYGNHDFAVGDPDHD
jgi:pimeloyl-ACP methyl ester carboxylesterase